MKKATHKNTERRAELAQLEKLEAAVLEASLTLHGTRAGIAECQKELEHQYARKNAAEEVHEVAVNALHNARFGHGPFRNIAQAR